jgi:hypothetical protein
MSEQAEVMGLEYKPLGSECQGVHILSQREAEGNSLTSLPLYHQTSSSHLFGVLVVRTAALSTPKSQDLSSSWLSRLACLTHPY